MDRTSTPTEAAFRAFANSAKMDGVVARLKPEVLPMTTAARFRIPVDFVYRLFHG
jgi:hypothetical protein